MTLMRAPLGERGSYLPTAINVVQCLGWTVFELLVIATAAAALSDELFGVEARGRGRSSSARPRSRWACSARSASSAPCSGGSRSGSCPLAIAYLAWWALTGGGLSAAWDRPGEGGLSTWQGVDIVVGVTVSWVPLAADYTRFARTPRGAFWGTGIGYLAPRRAAARARRGDPADARRRRTRRRCRRRSRPAGSSRCSRCVVLTVAETDEAFANAYSGAVSLQNLVPRGAAAAPDRRDDDRRHDRRARARADELPVVPLPARLVLRAALRGAARGLARSPGAPTTPTTSSARPRGGRADLRLDRRLWHIPVALPDRADLVGRAGAAARPAGVGDRRHAAELRRLVRARPRRVGRNRAGRCGSCPRMSPIGLIGEPCRRPGGRRRAATGRRCLPRRARRRAPRDRRRRRHALRTERPRGRARPARGARLSGDLRRRGGDDGVQLPLRGRHAGHDGGRGRRPVDGRGHRGLGGRGPRRLRVGARRRPPALALRRPRRRRSRRAGPTAAARRAGGHARRARRGRSARTRRSTGRCSATSPS